MNNYVPGVDIDRTTESRRLIRANLGVMDNQIARSDGFPLGAPVNCVGPSTGNSDRNSANLANALNLLLWRYVDLVDSSNHGGWSQEDDEAVRSVVATLREAGSPIVRPD